jgi:hypothetical protein
MKKENVTIEENEIPWDFTVVSCYLTDYVLHLLTFQTPIFTA